MKDENTYYIKVNSVDESTEIQEMYFEQGYIWPISGATVSCTTEPYLCINIKDKVIQCLTYAKDMQSYLDGGLFVIEGKDIDNLDSYFEGIKFDLL